MIRRIDAWLQSLSTRRFVVLASLCAVIEAAWRSAAVQITQSELITDRHEACEVERRGLAEWSSRKHYAYCYDCNTDHSMPHCKEWP